MMRLLFRYSCNDLPSESRLILISCDMLLSDSAIRRYGLIDVQ
mgnify:CR=1 FL=1